MKKIVYFLKGIIMRLLVPSLYSAIIFLIIGVLMISIPLYSVLRHSSYIETSAKIIEIGEEDGVSYAIYEFETDNGIVDVESLFVSGNINESTVIKYNPDNPEEFDIGSQKESHLSLIFGIFFTFFGVKQFYNTVKTIKEINDDNSIEDSLNI